MDFPSISYVYLWIFYGFPMDFPMGSGPKALMDTLLKPHGRHCPRELEHGGHGWHLRHEFLWFMAGLWQVISLQNGRFMAG